MTAIVFALFAAGCNAVSVTTRHIASTADPNRPAGWRLVGYLLTNPQWLAGWAAQIGAFLCQAIALHGGAVSVVQPLLVTELVIELVLRRVWIRQTITPAAWTGALVTCVGLAVFIVAAEPRGGNPVPVAGQWASAIAACVAVVVLLTMLAARGSPSRRAALLASAAAVTWALEATFIKTATDTLAQSGVAGMFARWPVYAVAAGGAIGVVLEQAALQAGPLRVSQPLGVIIDPVVSIALSVVLFGESFVMDPGVLTAAAIGFCAICAGVVVLTQTVPPTLQPDAAEPPRARSG